MIFLQNLLSQMINKIINIGILKNIMQAVFRPKSLAFSLQWINVKILAI